MPRYSITLRSSRDPRRKRVRRAHLETLFEAERHAQCWLEVVRLTSFGPGAYDSWSVSKPLGVRRRPEIIAHGGLDL
jgi:hypothetical protein